jgi:uncharacterized BrkB/YihY/UPF0761 family membrane protein/DNA-binding IscR family transcriptional regulator
MQSKFKHLWEATLAFFHETGIGREDDAKRPLFLRFAHFWLLVGKSFVRNRCPVRASALAYTTLLALIPLLAVGVSIGTSFLQSQGKQPVEDMIRGLVRNVAPMLDLEVKSDTAASENNLDKVVTNINEFIGKVNTGTVGITGTIALIFVAIGLLRTIEATFNDIWGITHGRGWVASIIQYWATITLGPVVLLLVVGLTTGPHFAKTKRILGLSLLTGRDIKDPDALMKQLLAPNTDIKPVAQFIRDGLAKEKDESFARAVRRFESGKTDPKSLRKTLAESLNGLLDGKTFYNTNLFAGVTLSAETARLLATNPKGHDLDLLNKRLLEEAFPEAIQRTSWEWVGTTGFYLLPFVLLSLAFGAFYQLMPNTRVQPVAALVGGIVGGTLWQLNNKLSVLYVSKAASYSQIYSGLAVIPLFLVGMYFSWLILLFGAQVAYAYQNRQSYLQEKQAEGVNQRGREFVALRVMTLIAQHFLHGEKPPGVNLIASTLSVPSRLVSRIVQPLLEAKLIVEVMDREVLYSPARPLSQITAHDVLLALRAGQGMELETRDDALRQRVRGEFESIAKAERGAAEAVTLETLAKADEK